MGESSKISNLSEQRIFKQLEYITVKMDSLAKDISDEVSVITRVESSLNIHIKMITKLSNDMDITNSRMREVEVSLSKKAGFVHLDERLTPQWESIHEISARLDKVELKAEKLAGKRSTIVLLFKWAVGLMTALSIAILTGKFK